MHADGLDKDKWWMSKGNDLAQNVTAFVSHTDKQQSYRSSDNLKYAKLYGNYEILGLDAYSYSRSNTAYNTSHRVTMNVVQSMIDTVVSKITKNKPRPNFLTEGGDFSLQQKAKKLTKFVDGIFGSTKYYAKSEKAFLDACIFGTGAIKIFTANGEIKCERVFIEELKVDDTEAYYSEPRQIHQVKYIHKDVLMGMFPKQAKLIEMADHTQDNYPNSNSQLRTRQMIKVTESWRLPSHKKANDGKHAITINELTLLDEKYEKSYFPFVFLRWGDRPVGFFGQGLAEQLMGLQLEINKILRTIQVSMHLVSVPKLLVEASSKIVTAHLNNKIGGIIRYAGTPPSYAQLGSIPPDLFSHLDRLYARAYEISGISQLSAQSSKPSGLDSGKALREFSHIESERFLSVARRYEASFIEAAEKMIDMARDLHKSNKDLKIKAKGSKFIETIKWSEVDMEEDKYMLDIFPASSLSQTPAGRLQDVQDLMAAGFIGREDGLKLLDFPDLEAANNMLNADAQNLDRIIEKMIDDGEYFPPEPYQNLENAVRKMQQAYLMFRMQGAPESRLELLRQYMEDAQGLIVKASQQGPATDLQATQALAEQGASTAAAELAENSGLGSEAINPVVEGNLDLSQLPEEPIE